MPSPEPPIAQAVAEPSSSQADPPPIEPESLRVTLHDSIDLVALESRWLELESRADTCLFTSWAWIHTWLEQLPPTAHPQLLMLWQGDLPVGLAIFVARSSWRRGLFFSRGLHLHETGHPTHDALAIEHNGLLTAHGFGVIGAGRVLDFFLKAAPHWDEIHLSGVAVDDPLLQAMRRRQTQHRLVTHRTAPSPYVDLGLLRHSRVDYLSQLSSNTRQQLRRAVRACEKVAPLQLTVARSIDEGQQFFTKLISLHRQRWHQVGQAGAFDNPVFERFHRTLLHKHLATGKVQLLCATAGDRTLGYLYNLVHEGRVSFYQSGFDYSDPKLKPGHVSHYLAIEHYLATGAREYDFLASDDQYKKSLATHTRPLVWASYQRRCWRFDLERQLRTWKRRWIKTGTRAESRRRGPCRLQLDDPVISPENRSMNLTARDIMQTGVRVIGPEITLPELEREFLAAKVSGFPVVQDGELIGIVSRSDIVRQLCVERTLAQDTSDFYFDESGFHETPLETFEQIADRVGERIEQLRVKDVMVRNVRTVTTDQPLKVIAQLLVDHRIHRLPVTQEGKLVGIVSALDLARVIAEGHCDARG